MHRTKGQLTSRSKPAAKPSKLVPALLGVAIIAAGFSTLMIRLEVTQEGYQLSALGADSRELQKRNRRLKLDVAQLSSHGRLRALALKQGMGPSSNSHVVILP
jgi:cell division protein FtsL